MLRLAGAGSWFSNQQWAGWPTGTSLHRHQKTPGVFLNSTTQSKTKPSQSMVAGGTTLVRVCGTGVGEKETAMFLQSVRVSTVSSIIQHSLAAAVGLRDTLVPKI